MTEDIPPDLCRAKAFMVCDVKNGLWQTELHEPSSHLTTFAAPFGRHQGVQMSLGIRPAPEVFQCELNQALEGLAGIGL